jgi:hypothetical protein
MLAKKWPPPEFPLVEGDHALTARWMLHLPEQFARRVEDGDLVLWRPGVTIWLTAWGNDKNESQSQRLASAKRVSSPVRFAEREAVEDGVTRFSYRLRDQNDNGPVESINSLVFADDGELQLSVYFDDPADEPQAWQIVESVGLRRQA